MDAETQRRLEEDGWVFGDAQSFLGLSDAQIDYIDLRILLSDAFRQRRAQQGLTQQQVAELLGSSQSRVAKMEAAHPSVSCDLLIKGLFALGVRLRELAKLVEDDVQENVA